MWGCIHTWCMQHSIHVVEVSCCCGVSYWDGKLMKLYVIFKEVRELWKLVKLFIGMVRVLCISVVIILFVRKESFLVKL